MARDLKTSLSSFKLSAEAKNFLELQGLKQLGDLNTYSLYNYKTILADEPSSVKEEIIQLLKRNFFPENVSELTPDLETQEYLIDNGLNTLEKILNSSRAYLYRLVGEKEQFLKSLNEIFSFFGLEALSDRDYDELEYKISTQEKAEEIDVQSRASMQLPNQAKSYGSKLYRHFKVRIASSDEIRMWSYGEVKKQETINHKSYKPEEGGLFCEKIFGPTKDKQCNCGKKPNANKGKCSKCGIEFTVSAVRRERMGHIELKSPVVHIWYLKNLPILANLIGIKTKDLEKVVYCSNYIVTEELIEKPIVKKNQIMTDTEYLEAQERYKGTFVALTGAECIRKILKSLDLERLIKVLRKEFITSNKQQKSVIIKRLKVVQAFFHSDNNPENIVMDAVPVLPPDLRPIVQLDGGRVATTDINNLYRDIINRNNRYGKVSIEIMDKNNRRLIQQAVETLFDNNKARNIKTKAKRKVKSLTDQLGGKQGRFRQNLLGKRVDYSGRSVIIVGPDLKMYQAGIPREMALVLYKPFIIKALSELPDVTDAMAAHKYDNPDEDVYRVLEEVVKEHPVLLNRAPTLHRLGIQAFEPKLIDSKAIRLHPLVTTAFNADFDGDQMAVHLPLSPEAQAEARLLMLASNNILNPKDGKPVVTPSQDMVLGNYFLTKEVPYDKDNPRTHKHVNEGMFFKDFNEVSIAFENKIIDYHTRILVKPTAIKPNFTEEQNSKYLITTYGKLIFNDIFPKQFPYLNEPEETNLENGLNDAYFLPKGTDPKEYFKNNEEYLKLSPKPFPKKFLSKIIDKIFKEYAITETSVMLDKLKDLGFRFSTVSAVTVAYTDCKVLEGKEEILEKAEKKVEAITEAYEDLGLLTKKAKHDEVIRAWEEAKQEIKERIKESQDMENDLVVMADSGARGDIDNFVQLQGVRGILKNPKGEEIEVPVKSSFREGLKVSEFFISTHGARKGSTDTALKTAQSGYLTRRLVDVSQDVIISEYDCGTEKGLEYESIRNTDGKVSIALVERIAGRFSMQKAYDEQGNLVIDTNTLITPDKAQEICKNHDTFKIRTNLTCDSKNGVCVKCYGINLATNKMVEVGEAVGVIAAQSIGEPGTQLTMNTFHTGGVASASDITQGLPRVEALFEARKPKDPAAISPCDGKITSIELVPKTNDKNSDNNRVVTILNKQGKEYKVVFDENKKLKNIEVGSEVEAGQLLIYGHASPKDLLRVAGREKTARYILTEVKKVYKEKEVGISDKHIEIVIRQMMRRVIVIQEGDTTLLPGIEVSLTKFKEANEIAFKNGLRPAVGKLIIYGISRAALSVDSFLSAASFQETSKVLTQAAVAGSIDELTGLKENVITGGLIPAGTGIIRDFSFSYPKEDEAIKRIEEAKKEALLNPYSI